MKFLKILKLPSRKKLILAGTGLALLIFMFLGWMSYWNSKKLLANQKANHLSRTVVYRFEELLSYMKDAQTGQRGFILTGKWSYLEPYYNGITAIHRVLRGLDEITKNDSFTQQRLRALEPLIDQCFEQLHQTILIRKNEGLPQAVQAISTGIGKKAMDRIRQLVSEVKIKELNRTQNYFQKSGQMARNTMRSLVIGFSLAFFLLIFTIHQLFRERHERKMLEAEKERLTLKSIAQNKLATLGEIATGVAHEINQPLSFIKIIFESTLRDVKSNRFDLGELVEDCRESLAQVERISVIIDHLRTFGRSDVLDFREIKLDTVLCNTLILFKRRLKLQNIVYKPTIQKNLPTIYGNAGKLEQVFINFFRNTIDSLEGRDDGEIEVSIYAKNSCVEICFTDNGSGIPDDIKDKIFEPFFTTKEVDKGTGLGLSISYGIIKEHNGNIECLARERGTDFLITLPIITARHKLDQTS